MSFIYFPHFFQPSNINGVPLAGAKLYFYASGTTTAITVYQDFNNTTPHTSPVLADASGIFPPVYISDATVSYKTVLKTALDVTVQTVDPIYTQNTQTGSQPIDTFAYSLLPRVAPSLFAGTIIPYYVGKVRSCTGPLAAVHNIDLKYRFLELYGSQMGTEDVFWDPENISGFASDAVVAGRGQFKLPYLSMAAAQGHANRRIVYAIGSGTDDLFAVSGSLKLNAAGTAPMPFMLIPLSPMFSFYGTGETARQMQAQGAGWVPDVAGGKPELYEKIAITGQEPETIYVRMGDDYNGGEIKLSYYSGRTAAYNAEYGWFVDTGTKQISMRCGSLNLAEYARLGRIRIVWRRSSISTVQGCPAYIERCRFIGLSQQTRYQKINLLGVDTDVRAASYWQDCVAEDSGGSAAFAWKNLGCIAVYNRCQSVNSGYDGFNYDPDTYTGVIVGGTLTLPESAEIDCVVRSPGQLQNRTLRSLIESGPFPGLRNLQASSIHEGYLVRINGDYSDALGQVVADTNAGEGSINIGCKFANTRVALLTNPSATASPFQNGEDQYYDLKFPAAEFYGSVWNDSCIFGSASASAGASLVGAGSIGWTFNSHYEGTVPTIGTFNTYNPSTGI